MTNVVRLDDFSPVDAELEGDDLSVLQRINVAVADHQRRAGLREMHAREILTHEAELVLEGLPQTALKDDAALPFNQ